MVDSGPSGGRRDLWALPSEELPPGAAVFLDMARDLQAALDDAPAPWIVTPGRVLPDPGPSEAETGQDARSEDTRPDLRLVRPPVDAEGAGEPTRTASAGPLEEEEEDPGVRTFLEMVDRADTVRPLPSGDGDPEPAVADWLWPEGEEGNPAADALLSTIEQAIWHVNHSENIRNEELRSRLLDLFTDFAVRRPWKEEERPEAQRIQRLMEQARDEGPDEQLR